MCAQAQKIRTRIMTHYRRLFFQQGIDFVATPTTGTTAPLIECALDPTLQSLAAMMSAARCEHCGCFHRAKSLRGCQRLDSKIVLLASVMCLPRVPCRHHRDSVQTALLSLRRFVQHHSIEKICAAMLACMWEVH